MMLALELDRDAAGHLAVALHALGTRNRQQGRVFPAALVALQAAAENVVQTGEPMRLSISSVSTHRCAPSPAVKVKANKLVAAAINRGDLQRPDACESCGRQTDRIEAHHDDYMKPLEIRWLCRRCHRQADTARREQEALSLTEPHGAALIHTVEDHRHDDSHGTRPYLTRTDVARIADVSIATVDRWLTGEQLPSHKVGRIRRIRRSDLDRFLGCAT